MTAHVAIYISPLVVSAAVLVALLVVTWRSRSDAVAPWFAATLVAFLIWTVGYIFEILSPTLAGKLLWADVEFIGIALLPVAWFEVVRRYTGPRPAAALGRGTARRVRRRLRRRVPQEPRAHLPRRPAPRHDHLALGARARLRRFWAAFFMPVVYLLLGASVLLLAHAIWRDHQGLYRRQYALLIVALVLPVAGRHAVHRRDRARARLQSHHRRHQRLRRHHGLGAVPLPAVRHRATGARHGGGRPLGRGHRARHLRPHRRLQPRGRDAVPGPRRGRPGAAGLRGPRLPPRAAREHRARVRRRVGAVHGGRRALDGAARRRAHRRAQRVAALHARPHRRAQPRRPRCSATRCSSTT